MSIRHRNNGISYRICEHSNIVGLEPEEYCVIHAYAYLLPFRHQRERRTHLKQRHHNQNTTNRMPKGPFLSQTSGQMAIEKKKKISKTYMQRHTRIVDQRERRTHLKQRHHNQNTTNRIPKGPFLSQTSARWLLIKKSARHTCKDNTMTEIVNHSRSAALERSVKTLLGGL